MATFNTTTGVDRPQEKVSDQFRRVIMEHDTIQHPEKECKTKSFIEEMLDHPTFDGNRSIITDNKLSHDIVMFKFMLTRITGMFNMDFPDVYVDVYIDSKRHCYKVNMDSLPINTKNTSGVTVYPSIDSMSISMDSDNNYVIFAYVLDYVFSVEYNGKSYKTLSAYCQTEDSYHLLKPNIRWFNSWGSDSDEVKHKEFFPFTVAEILNLDQLGGINYSNAFKGKITCPSYEGWSDVNVNVKNMLEIIDLGKVFVMPKYNCFKYYFHLEDEGGVPNVPDICDLVMLTYDLWDPKNDRYDGKNLPARLEYPDYDYIYTAQHPAHLFMDPRFARKFDLTENELTSQYFDIDESKIRPEILEASEIALSILNNDMVDSTVYRTETMEIEVFQTTIKIDITIMYKNVREQPSYYYHSKSIIPESLISGLDYLLDCTFGARQTWNEDMAHISKIGFFKALCEEGVNTNMDLISNLKKLKIQRNITFKFKDFESDAIQFIGIDDIKVLSSNGYMIEPGIPVRRPAITSNILLLLNNGMSRQFIGTEGQNRRGGRLIDGYDSAFEDGHHLITVDSKLMELMEFESNLSLCRETPIISVKWGLAYLESYLSDRKSGRKYYYKLVDSCYSRCSISIEHLAEYFNQFGNLTDINGVYFSADFDIEREVVNVSFNLDKFREV